MWTLKWRQKRKKLHLMTSNVTDMIRRSSTRCTDQEKGTIVLQGTLFLDGPIELEVVQWCHTTAGWMRCCGGLPHYWGPSSVWSGLGISNRTRLRFKMATWSRTSSWCHTFGTTHLWGRKIYTNGHQIFEVISNKVNEIILVLSLGGRGGQLFRYGLKLFIIWWTAPFSS